MRAGDAAQIGFRGAPEIEKNQAEVGIAGEEVGRLERERRGQASHPEEVGEQIGGIGIGIKTVGAIDQRDAEPLAPGGDQELLEEEMAPATRRGADELCDGTEGQSAGRRIDGRDPGGEEAGGGARRGREALGEQMPERRQLFGHGHRTESGRRRKPERSAGGGESGRARTLTWIWPGLAGAIPASGPDFTQRGPETKNGMSPKHLH